MPLAGERAHGLGEGGPQASQAKTVDKVVALHALDAAGVESMLIEIPLCCSCVFVGGEPGVCYGTQPWSRLQQDDLRYLPAAEELPNVRFGSTDRQPSKSQYRAALVVRRHVALCVAESSSWINRYEKSDQTCPTGAA